MKIYAELNNLRMSPRKVRLAVDAIRGKRVPDAERTLRFLTRRAADPVGKLLRSAAASARQNFQINESSSLVVSEVRVDAGPTMKRQRARARGRAAIIRKRTSRILLVLEAAGIPEVKTKRSSNIEMVHDLEPTRENEDLKTMPKRPLPERQVKVSKPTNFVQRMFRRKAI